MMKFFAGVLSVIAAGVLLIAYGLLSPRAAAFDMRPTVDQFGRPLVNSGRVSPDVDTYGVYPAYGYPAQPMSVPLSYPTRASAPSVAGAYPAAAGYPAYPQTVAYQPVEPVRTVVTERAPRRVVTQRVVEHGPRRDWKKTALVIGGSTASGAGVGAIVGGKKGALIGAAIGGGASTIYEATKR